MTKDDTIHDGSDLARNNSTNLGVNIGFGGGRDSGCWDNRGVRWWEWWEWPWWC